MPSYNSLIQLRKSFCSEWVYINKEGKAVIDASDLHDIMQFYRQAIKKGTVLNLGAGTTHFHYMLAIEDKLTHITALDLGKEHIQILQDFFNYYQNPPKQARFISKKDLNIFQITAQSVAQDSRYGQDRSREEIIKNIICKSTNNHGKLDCIYGDMYQLDVLGDRKFDNIILSFSLFISRDKNDMLKLFTGIRKHLSSEGRIIIADFEGVGDSGFGEKEAEDFPELPKVRNIYSADFDLDQNILADYLRKAGFKEVKVKTVPVEVEGIEKEHNLNYLFAQAKV
ncbi:MAG: hypothetical protein Q7R97_01280 [Candidatus Daviesbacteria bacterium]|nr:hypothetical protein [Candidatus Daviesbacteria bacterium]